ncbi:MAG: porin [Pseudomonadales bacterium]|nr:porin [Pseudomonadales bacterium]
MLAGSNTLYGDFRYSLNGIDAGAGAGSVLSGQSNASRVGLKGTTDKEEGISAFYHLQAGASIDTDGAGDAITQRFFFAGVKGGFGKIVYGRTSTPYKMAGLKLDPFYDTSAGAGLGGATYGLSGLTNAWTDNSLAYSKKLGKISINGSMYLDDSAADKHDMNLGVTVTQGSLVAGVQYLDVGAAGVIAKSTANSSAIRFHAKYGAGPWSVGGSIESIDPSAGSKQSYLYLSGTYMLSDKTKVAASYGSVDDVSTAVDGDGINLGIFHQVLKKTNVYALYSDVSAGTDRSTIAVGVSHKFAVK